MSEVRGCSNFSPPAPGYPRAGAPLPAAHGSSRSSLQLLDRAAQSPSRIPNSPRPAAGVGTGALKATVAAIGVVGGPPSQCSSVAHRRGPESSIGKECERRREGRVFYFCQVVGFYTSRHVAYSEHRDLNFLAIHFYRDQRGADVCAVALPPAALPAL